MTNTYEILLDYENVSQTFDKFHPNLLNFTFHPHEINDGVET